jgi:putative restriction enzyme
MDKNAIKKYAIWARNELIERVSQKADQYEISAEADPNADSAHGALLTADEKKQRAALIGQIKEKGQDQVMEEVAYTWFNRFSALRFMEVNNYLPSRIRVFTDENGKFKPEILTEAIHLDLDGLDMEKVYALKDANDDDALYKYLIITQCNALSGVLPEMFQKISDYTELLFPDNLLRESSVIEQMVTQIPEEDWKDQVQIIGWLYQYYNTEPKDKVFADLKKNKKITKEKIPAATQLFTPDWIVRYMVENSLGRLWVEGHPNDELKSNWKYYLDEAKQEPDVQKQLDEIRKEYSVLTPGQIRCVDPCMGSGHILCYMFDVLMQIYEAYGYTARDAVSSIVKNNLYGLDIDERASQLAYFAVMMKACQYDRRFLSRGIQPHVYAIMESNGFDSHMIDYFTDGRKDLKSAMNSLISDLHDAKEYGSLLDVKPVDFAALYARFNEIREQNPSVYTYPTLNQLFPFVEMAEAMAQKYHAVVTNPPYMGRRKSMTAKMTDYLDHNYPDGKMDLFSSFILKNLAWINENGYVGMMTPYVWLYLNSFVDLRKVILNTAYLQSVVQLEKSAFSDATVSICTFVLGKKQLNYNGIGINLENFPGEDIQPVKVEEAAQDISSEYIYHTNMQTYKQIPDCRFGFWVTEGMIRSFKNPVFESIVAVKQGITTSDNERFLRLWYEVQFGKIGFGLDANQAKKSIKKWFPYSKGGENRRWYGNNEYIINYENDGAEIKAFHEVINKTHPGGRLKNKEYYFKKSITWSDICGTNFAVRSNEQGFLFDVKGSCAFVDDCIYYYVMAFMNTKVVVRYCNLFNPSVTTQVGDIKQIPLIIDQDAIPEITELAKKCIAISKEEWDSHEQSWDFKRNVLLNYDGNICGRIKKYVKYVNCQIDRLCEYEKSINDFFINIYEMRNEIDSTISRDTVTIEMPREKKLILELISYAVGCMMGRYSLDVDDLAYAGGEWDNSKYKTFIPDKDAIIPITDDEYFTDDIVGRFVEFVRTVYGDDTLEENLKFIADALDGKGSTSREVIRNYFLNDFYKDHCKTYQKRPIYWLFDSGKKNGFKCLIYMHRYQPDTIARIRTDYVHEQQARYRTAISGLERQIYGASTSERVRLNKQLDKLKDQAEETRLYEEKIHHLADQMISIDLDDGVKHNYAIFQDVLAKIK